MGTTNYIITGSILSQTIVKYISVLDKCCMAFVPDTVRNVQIHTFHL